MQVKGSQGRGEGGKRKTSRGYGARGATGRRRGAEGQVTGRAQDQGRLPSFGEVGGEGLKRRQKAAGSRQAEAGEPLTAQAEVLRLRHRAATDTGGAND